jgi:hypothetical protein
MMTNPIQAFIQAAVNLGTITQYQGAQTEQNPDVASGRKAPFDLWVAQDTASPGALPTVLRASLLLLAQDQAYANQYRGDLVLASILLDQEKLVPRTIHQELYRLHFARAQGMDYALDEFLAKQRLIPLETSRNLLATTTFPEWLPITRRSKIAGVPPKGIKERRKGGKISRRLARQHKDTKVGLIAAAIAGVIMISGLTLWLTNSAPVHRIQEVPPIVRTPTNLPDPVETPTIQAPTPIALAQDLIDCPVKVRALIDESRDGNRDLKLSEARLLLEKALSRLEHEDSKEGQELRGECQALLQLVLKLSR